MKQTYLIAVVLVVVFAAGGFFAGMKYQESQASSFRNFGAGGIVRQDQRAQGTQGTQGTQVFRPVRGEIISADDKSITVKQTDGSSKIVLLSDKTTITEASSAAKTNLQNGKQVAVVGVENSDGSIFAQDIQLNPVVRQNSGGVRQF